MNKNIKIKKSPAFRQPVNRCDPESYDKKHLRILFNYLDFEHDWWGWDHLSKEQYLAFMKFIQGMESQSWAEIKLTAGGKRKGTNHHSIELHKFSKAAQDRLTKLNLTDVVGDSLFSLRLSSIVRIYGIRDKEYFSPIWHDPFHDDHNKAAYILKN